MSSFTKKKAPSIREKRIKLNERNSNRVESNKKKILIKLQLHYCNHSQQFIQQYTCIHKAKPKKKILNFINPKS